VACHATSSSSRDLEPHLTTADRKARDRGCHDGGGPEPGGSHRHFLWLLARGLTATAVARVTGYSAYWVGQIVRRYNRDGPDGVRDRRHTAQVRPRVLLPEGEHADLRTALAAPHPAGDRWCGRSVACLAQRARWFFAVLLYPSSA
jgi:Homeodomain-like domain